MSEDKRPPSIDAYLEQFNDPELTECVNNLLLRFDLRLLSAALAPGHIGAVEAASIAWTLAGEESDGDDSLQQSLYQIFMANWREGGGA